MAYTIALIADNHFIINDDKVYVNGTYTKQYLSRFTSNFDNVIVIARGRNSLPTDDFNNLRESGGDRVAFHFIDDFLGVKSYVYNRKLIKSQIKSGIINVDAVIVRMPCILTTLSLDIANQLQIPFMIDVGADPETIYVGTEKNIFIQLLSKYLRNVCKRSCKRANGVSYVTKRILQDKYPCKAIMEGESVNYFTASISNVDINDDFFNSRSYSTLDEIRLIHVSNNISENSSKGHQEAIQVLELIKKKGYRATLTFLGDGNGVNELKELASKLGVLDSIIFKGRIVERNAYRDCLKSNDFFIFPSHSEGLPRVLIEAMATGMVCISSNVDGIPELLDANDIFEYSDINGMSERIISLFNDKGVLNTVSYRNHEKAKEYSYDSLKCEIDSYFAKVRALIDFRLSNKYV